jgi:hypothetical protein
MSLLHVAVPGDVASNSQSRHGRDVAGTRIVEHRSTASHRSTNNPDDEEQAGGGEKDLHRKTSFLGHFFSNTMGSEASDEMLHEFGEGIRLSFLADGRLIRIIKEG